MPNLDLDAIEARAQKATKGTRIDTSTGWTDVSSGDGYACILFARFLSPGDAMFFMEAEKDIPALIARVRELEAENARLKEKRLSNLESAERMADRVERLTDDNAALRLAATELYELVTHGCGFDPEYGVIARMAQVLGVKDGQEPTE